MSASTARQDHPHILYPQIFTRFRILNLVEKTVSLGFISEGNKGNGGDTVVAALRYLIPQWKDEIENFIVCHI